MPILQTPVLKTMRLVIALLSIVVALIIPVGYAFIQLNDDLYNARFMARIEADSLNRMINSNPNYWQFEEPRLLEILENNRHGKSKSFIQQRITDTTNKTVIEAHTKLSLPWFAFHIAVPLLDSGETVGYLEVTHSLLPIVGPITAVLVLGVLVGLAIYNILTRLPLATLERALEQLRQERELAQVTLNAIDNAVIRTDKTGRILYVNPVATKLTGYSYDECMDQNAHVFFNLKRESTGATLENPIDRIQRTGSVAKSTQDAILVRKDGSSVPVDDSAASVFDSTGDTRGYVLVFHDTSASRELAAKLRYQAKHDPLTGLINRTELEYRLNRAIDSAIHEKIPHALAYLDLDRFKVVNDTAGHSAGDELLKQICAIIRKRIRAADTFARMGGDEFALLLEGCPIQIAQRVCQSIVDAIQEFRFSFEGQNYSVGISIGLVEIDSYAGSVAQLISSADSACYAAKERGRGRLYTYTPGDDEIKSRQGELQWATRITCAIDDNRWRIHYQEIKPLQGIHERDHFEILLRMVDERGELVPPSVFIPAAERFNLMKTLDRWVIQTTYLALNEIYGNSIADRLEMCAINLSATSLADETLTDFIEQQNAKYQIPAHVICFEVTETVAIGNINRAAAMIQNLRSKGFQIALDDFGSGVSSFSYLKSLPVNFVKIDGSFIKNILEDPIERAMVESINQIGHILGVKTIAEFIENEETAKVMRDMGVDYGQGYGIAVPKPMWLLER